VIEVAAQVMAVALHGVGGQPLLHADVDQEEVEGGVERWHRGDDIARGRGVQ
jgi:hypothetical protein